METLTTQEAIQQLTEMGLTFPTPERVVRSSFGGGKIFVSNFNHLKNKIRDGYKIFGHTPVVS